MIVTSISNRKNVTFNPKFGPRLVRSRGGFNDPRMWANNDGARKLLAVFNLYLEIRTAVCPLQRSTVIDLMR